MTTDKLDLRGYTAIHDNAVYHRSVPASTRGPAVDEVVDVFRVDLPTYGQALRAASSAAAQMLNGGAPQAMYADVASALHDGPADDLRHWAEPHPMFWPYVASRCGDEGLPLISGDQLFAPVRAYELGVTTLEPGALEPVLSRTDCATSFAHALRDTAVGGLWSMDRYEMTLQPLTEDRYSILSVNQPGGKVWPIDRARLEDLLDLGGLVLSEAGTGDSLTDRSSGPMLAEMAAGLVRYVQRAVQGESPQSVAAAESFRGCPGE